MATAAGAALGLGTGALGCASEPAPEVAEEEVIGGVAANSASLDAIGSLGIADPYGQVQPFCTATLVGQETVLTARHCSELFDSGIYTGYGYRIVFAIGPDGYSPRRTVDVVASTELPRGDQQSFVGYWRDIAALHLDTPITDIAPARMAALTDRDIGRDFAVIGYGMRNNAGEYGIRRAGTVELRARSGRIFEMIFGSYEAFREWLVGQGHFGVILDRAELERELGITFPAEDEDGGPPPDDGDAGVPDDGGPPPDDSDAGPPPDDGDAGPDDYYEQLYRQYYETTYLLPEYEAWVGNTEGDAQICHGDSGGPLTRIVNGQLRVFGVASWGIHSREMYCNYGGMYAVFGQESLDAANEARRWRDPCGDATALGECRGDVAVRCTGAGEGPRRVTRTRCNLLGQTCGTGDDGQVACVDP
ncbi:trypsin-like serine protease [Sandaracinus amylolyticus]|uniref:trypsin-like serine protease n=1 Tax=Sandaracinus amylolyticus TaxID=927083 RepID=UPI001F30C47A|nr:trypsin-like serine protease [Sandaracinus amylolyticus]UJR83494.1 Hypothetical protein I5071_55620 [Sandaracinus amylolyticus]